MARLRVSFSNAIKMVFELTKDGKESLESAVHKAALEFNENEPELLQKVKSIIDRESRKTGKVGRPPKKANNENTNVSNEQKVTSNKGKNKNNSNNKVNNMNKNAKKAANTDNLDKPVKAEEVNYIYSGPVDIYCFNGDITTIDISIKIAAYDENDAILRIYEEFFNKKVPLCISTKSWKKYISEAK